MTVKRVGGVLCLLLGYLAGLPRGSGAQEPGFFYGNGALRYAEATGYFHYVFPCGVEGAGATGSLGKPAPLSGVCWPVYAGRRLHADGSADLARPVPGVLLVTTQVVVFIPDEKANEGVLPQLLPSEIRYSYDARQVVASMETTTGTYSFTFRAVCEGCKSGTPVIDPSKKTQLMASMRNLRGV